jgi:hypothetical protein
VLSRPKVDMQELESVLKSEKKAVSVILELREEVLKLFVIKA